MLQTARKRQLLAFFICIEIAQMIMKMHECIDALQLLHLV